MLCWGEMVKADKQYLVWGIAALAVISIFYYAYNSMAAPGKYDGFAQCINDKGLVMYGASWCGHCQSQKAMFGKSFKYVNYVECTQKQAVCDANQVTGYPTWIAADGTRLIGEQPLEALGRVTGCAVT